MASGRKGSNRRNPQKLTSKQRLASAADAIVAVDQGDVEAVRLFLENDDGSANYFGGSDSQPTMLQIAARNGNFKMVELLMDHYCQINAQLPETGDTALLMALDWGNKHIAELLIRHEKCDYNVQNNEGYTALMKAAEAGLISTMEQLLAYGPDLECQTVDGGDTALSLAVKDTNPESVQLLVDYGANLKHVTASGKTPVELAWGLPESAAKRQICETLMRCRRNARTGSPDASSLIGQRYKKLGILGDGAHGLALLVRDMRVVDYDLGTTNRLKVLKRVSRCAAVRDRPDSGGAALQEISLLKQLDHSCVLSILDYFNDGDSVCIVTEYCELRDLQHWIQWAGDNQIALPPSLVVHWSLQMLIGLHYLHGLNVVHRDFKPSNVFVKADSTIRIGDFGSSRQLLDTRDLAKTICGSWLYMSPEVLQNENYGTECDMWSLGCTLYELCTGRPLFDASASRAQLKAQICGDQALPALPGEHALPEWLRGAFAQLMVRAPASSRPSAEALLRADGIRQALDAMGPEELTHNRTFLSDNRAGIFPDPADGGGVELAEFMDFTHAYDALLADAQRALEATGDADGHELGAFASAAPAEEAEAMMELERLRSQLAAKQRDGFPLDKVYQLLQKNLHQTPERKQRLLAKVTRDTDGGDMVARAIALELQCLMPRD